MFPGDRERPSPSDQDGVGVLDVAPTDIRVVDKVDEIELVPSYAAAIDEATLLLLEGYEFVPDLEEHESKSGTWCCHFILSLRFRWGIVAGPWPDCTVNQGNTVSRVRRGGAIQRLPDSRRRIGRQ